MLMISMHSRDEPEHGVAPARSPTGVWAPAPDVNAVAPLDEIRRSLGVLAALSSLSSGDLIRRRMPPASADLVSVVVPMRNAREWIDDCLRGLLAQTHEHLEVFAVDDCSDDDTYGRAVDRFGADRRVAFFRMRRRVGPYQIKNWVIATLARGRFVALQDADDVSHPTRIAEQLDWMRGRDLRVCGTCVHQIAQPHLPRVLGTDVRLVDGGAVHNLAIYDHVPQVDVPQGFRDRFGERRFFLVKHGSQIYEREVFREFGGFDGRTILAADMDMNWRLLRFMPLGNVPKVLYTRRIHEGSLTRSPETGYRSAARLAYRARCDEFQEHIARLVGEGRLAEVRALCVGDWHYGELEVAEAHGGV